MISKSPSIQVALNELSVQGITNTIKTLATADEFLQALGWALDYGSEVSIALAGKGVTCDLFGDSAGPMRRFYSELNAMNLVVKSIERSVNKSRILALQNKLESSVKLLKPESYEGTIAADLKTVVENLKGIPTYSAQAIKNRSLNWNNYLDIRLQYTGDLEGELRDEFGKKAREKLTAVSEIDSAFCKACKLVKQLVIKKKFRNSEMHFWFGRLVLLT